MPSSKNYVRDYKQEAGTAKKRGEQGVGSTSGSAQRHRARRKMIKAGHSVAGKDVDHKNPIKSGGSNATSNLRMQSPSVNRSIQRKRRASLRD